jgi:hypothetical protein
MGQTKKEVIMLRPYRERSVMAAQFDGTEECAFMLKNLFPGRVLGCETVTSSGETKVLLKFRRFARENDPPKNANKEPDRPAIDYFPKGVWITKNYNHINWFSDEEFNERFEPSVQSRDLFQPCRID